MNIPNTVGLKIKNIDPTGDRILYAGASELLLPTREAVAADSRFPWRQHPKNSFMTVYTRVTWHAIQTRRRKAAAMYKTVDLAAIEVSEQFRERGIFRHVLRELQSIANESGRVLYIENVLNDILLYKFTRNPDFHQLRQVGGVSDNCFAYIPPNAKPVDAPWRP